MHGAVGMPAGAATVDLTQPAVEPDQKARIGLAPGQPGQVIGNGGQPVHAGAALAGALARQVGDDAGRLHEAAGTLAEHDDHTDPGRRSDRTKRERRVGRGEVLWPDPGAAVAPDEEGLRVAGRQRPAGDVDQWCAPLNLHHAGVLHRSGDGDQARPGILGQSTGAELRRAGAGDHGHVCQRLGVVHQGAVAADPQGNALVGPERRE